MEQLKKRVANLASVKSIVTVLLTVIFGVLALRRDISGQDLLTIFLIVISFYFGTQSQKVQEALDAYNELTAEQKELVTAKNQQKLFDCCAALDISVDGGDIDLEALELQQEEASRQAAIIEQFVLAEDEDDASLEEDFDESVDE